MRSLRRALLAGLALTILAFGLFFVASSKSGDDNGAAATGEEERLGRALLAEIGETPEVQFICQLPVVGAAPCLPGEAAGRREVLLTFTDYPLPSDIDPRAHARDVARLAHQISSLARQTDMTRVIFVEGDELASVTRKYSFPAGELLAGASRP